MLLFFVKYLWHTTAHTQVNFEISFDEKIILEPTTNKIIHGYPEEYSHYINIYKLEEVIAEKLRAILQKYEKKNEKGWSSVIWDVFS